MTQVIGLFSEQKAAEKAIDALTKTELDDDIDIRTIDKWTGGTFTPLAAPAPHATGSGLPGVGLPSTEMSPSLDLDDEEAQFFKRGVQAGGVLVVVDVADNDLLQVKSILQKQGGQVTA